MTSNFDRLFASLTTRQKFFSNGIGDEAYMKEIPNYIANVGAPTQIKPQIIASGKWMGLAYWDFSFISPMADLLPQESAIAYGRYLAPNKYPVNNPFDSNTRTIIHFAGTADQGYNRRSLMLGLPLAKQGIASILLENAYYGIRRPQAQNSYYLQDLTDLFKLGHATGQEGRSLIHWLQTDAQVQSLLITGISMGGLVCAIVGALADKPLAMVPFVPPHGPEAPYMDMALKHHVDWKRLHLDLSKKGVENQEQFLRDFMRHLDIRRFNPPARPELVHLISAEHDAYIPQSSTEIFLQHWPGIQTTLLNSGHVGSVLFHSRTYLKILQQMFERF